MGALVTTLALVIAIVAIYNLLNNPNGMPHFEHGSHRFYFPHNNFSAQDYYGMVKEALKEHAIPDLSFSEVEFRQKGLLSSKRMYLRVKKEQYLFDICAAPYGKDFFVSWWFGEKFTLFFLILTYIPIVRWFALRSIRKRTYHQRDTQSMFEEAIKMAVGEAIEAMTQEKGIRTQQAYEAQPN